MLNIHPTLVLDIHLAFSEIIFILDMDSDSKLSVTRLSVNKLDLTQQVILDNILSLLNIRTGVSEKNFFSLNQVNTMIIIYLLIESANDFNIYIITFIIIIVCIQNNVCHNITVYHVSMK